MNGPALLALQLTDTEIDHIAAVERRLPERAALDAAQLLHRAWRTERARFVGAIDAATAGIEQNERDARAIDTKRTRLEAQLKTIIAPREAEALMHEIALLTDQRNGLDDVELAAMETQSEAEAGVLDLDAREPALLDAVAIADGALAACLAKLAGERDTLLTRRSESVASLEVAELATYEALRARFGGVGLVQLDGRRCTGCHLDLSAGEADIVKSAPEGALPECPHCDRLIVR